MTFQTSFNYSADTVTFVAVMAICFESVQIFYETGLCLLVSSLPAYLGFTPLAGSICNALPIYMQGCDPRHNEATNLLPVPVEHPPTHLSTG